MQGRDLSPITDELWLKCYSRKFGNDAVEMVKRRMADRKCKFKWKQLYQVQRWLASWGDGQICILMNNPGVGFMQSEVLGLFPVLLSLLP